MGPAARHAERVSQRAWRQHVPLHARGTSCALASAVAAGMAAAVHQPCRARVCIASTSPARVQWALDNLWLHLSAKRVRRCMNLKRNALMHCLALFSRHTLLLGSHGCEMVLSGDKNYVVTDGIGPPRGALFGGLSSLREVVLTY